jgi:FKBP-type peptidyl-prolyl cis-trans isomerase 2
MRARALLGLTSAGLLCVSAARAEDPAVVKDGSKVTLEYTLALDDGQKMAEADEIELVQGRHDVLPAFERELTGMKVNDTKKFTLSVEDAYGPVKPELMKEVPAAQIPEEGRKVGAHLVAQDQAGNQKMVRIAELKGDTVVLDLNHPLAGQRLHFDLKVLKIE